MADFYVGILKTIKNNRKGDKVTYKGIAIGAELVKNASIWVGTGVPDSPVEPSATLLF
ncbi:MAG: hypothetical protein GY941_12890 [Planctomycetes bacterium]|nr:hypothetical protein [Planctomycetota bacterium]